MTEIDVGTAEMVTISASSDSTDGNNTADMYVESLSVPTALQRVFTCQSNGFG
jgi:hypothetical protein